MRDRISFRGTRGPAPWLVLVALFALVVSAPAPAYAAQDSAGNTVADISFGEVAAGGSMQLSMKAVAAKGWTIDQFRVASGGTEFEIVGAPVCANETSGSSANCIITVQYNAPAAVDGTPSGTATMSNGTLEVTFVQDAEVESTLSAQLTGASRFDAPCTTCTVTSSVFYEPQQYNRFVPGSAPGQDLFGETTYTGIKRLLPFSSNSKAAIHMPKEFADADTYLDLSGAAGGQSTLPQVSEAGNYRDTWQIAVKPGHTLVPGDTITISVPQPADSHPADEGGPFLGAGTRFPAPSVTVPASATTGTDDVDVLPYAIVPKFHGCGWVNLYLTKEGGVNDCTYSSADGWFGAFTGATAPQVAVQDNGRRVTITVPPLDVDPVAKSHGQPTSLEAGVPFTVMIAGVIAPPAGTYADRNAFTVSTSKDLVPAPNGHGAASLYGISPTQNPTPDLAKPETYALSYKSLGVPDAGRSRLTTTATSGSVGLGSSDGVSATLQLRDALYNAMGGYEAAIVDAAALTSDPDTNVQITPPQPAPAGTDLTVTAANGELKVDLRDTTVEDVRLAAVAYPKGPGDPVLIPCPPGPVADTTNTCNLPTVSFHAGNPAPPPRSSIAVDHVDRPADGLSAAKVTVTLKDQYGNPDLGHRVTLATAEGSMQATVRPDPASYCVADNPAKGACTGTAGTKAGVAVFDVTANRAGTVRLGVTDLNTLTVFPTDPDPQNPDAELLVAEITFHGISTTNSTVIAADTTVPMGSCTDVTVSVLDDESPGVGMQGRVVELTSDSDTATVSADDNCPPTAASARATTTAVNGQATFKVSNTAAKSATFTARVIADGVVLPQRATVSFTKASSLVASPAVVVGDGEQATTLTLTLRSRGGGAASGQCVGVQDGSAATSVIVPLSPLASGCPSTAPVKTDQDGVALFRATSTSAGTVTYTATAPTTYDVGPARATVRYLAVPTAQSTLSSDATEVEADGVATSRVTLTAKDAAGQPIAGLTVRLAQAAGTHATIQALSATSGITEAVTDDFGVAEFRVTDDNIEKVTLRAEYESATWKPLPTPSLDIDFTQPVNEAYNSTVAIACDPPGSACSNTALAGGPTLTVEVTLLDRDNLPLPRHAVALRSTQASLSFEPITEFGITDPDGVVRFAVSSTSQTGDAVIHATDLETGVILDQSVTVKFLQPPPTDAAQSTITVTPDSVPAGGATSRVDVTLVNGAGEPQTDHRVALSTGSTRTVVSGGLPTDQSGTTTFWVSGTVAETVALSALDLTDSVTLGAHPTITFTTAPTQANQSVVTVSPDSLPAGGPKSTVSVTLMNASGSPLSGHTVRLETGSTTTTVLPLTAGGVTDSSGVVRFTVSDTAVESVVIRATDVTNGTLLDDTPTISFLATEANGSTVVASPANQVIRATSTITVTLVDSDGNPLAGHTVGLALSSTVADLDGSTKVTGANGVVTFTLTGVTPGQVVVTATDLTSGVVLNQTATVTFFKKGRVR